MLCGFSYPTLSQGNLLGETSEGNGLIAHDTRKANAVVSKLCHAAVQVRARHHPCSPLRSARQAEEEGTSMGVR